MINFIFLAVDTWIMTREKVVQETINALKSMMSTNDVMAFSTLCGKDKIESLSGIREIVCGMRAFNKDAGHCGEGLVDSKYRRVQSLFTIKWTLHVSLGFIEKIE